MATLPERSNIDHLRKQAKELLRLYRSQDPVAFERLRHALPVAKAKTDAQLSSLDLRLHDMQSCIAREYGLASWAELKSQVELQALRTKEAGELLRYWLRLAYSGDITGTTFGARPHLAAELLAERPDLAQGDPWLACTVGDEDAIRAAIATDPTWIHRAGGPLKLPPLVAVTHSSLLRVDPFRERLHRCAKMLLDAGASANQCVGNRWPPHSLDAPGEDQLTAIYGATGQNHDARLTKVLLDAGADPNDNESLYHSIPHVDCMRVLLDGGTRIEGTNGIGRSLDFADPAPLALLLERGADPNALVSGTTHPLIWAIHRGRSAAHVKLLLDAGADPSAKWHDGVSAYRLARLTGSTEVAELLDRAGAGHALNEEDLFVAACARGDEQQARRIQSLRPGLPKSLPPHGQALLPLCAFNNRDAAVRTMVKLGWPIAARGADIGGSALNCAVFRGNAALTRFLLEQGASWRERHNYDSDVIGTLGWASCNRPEGPGDWLGCAKALVEHGMPRARRPPDSDPDEWPRYVIIDGREHEFPEDITALLLNE
jgi:ankyrin repeat protein